MAKIASKCLSASSFRPPKYFNTNDTQCQTKLLAPSVRTCHPKGNNPACSCKNAIISCEPSTGAFALTAIGERSPRFGALFSENIISPSEIILSKPWRDCPSSRILTICWSASLPSNFMRICESAILDSPLISRGRLFAFRYAVNHVCKGDNNQAPNGSPRLRERASIRAVFKPAFPEEGE